MDVALLTDKDAKREAIRLVRESISIDVAVAWAGRNKVLDELAEHHRKLRHMVIGTHMYQTDPWVLRRFMAYQFARCMPPSGQLFHPKVYLFELNTSVAAIIGSHNLTAGAFEGGNIEASVVLRTASSNRFIRELTAFVRTQWHSAKPIDEERFLFSYEAQYKINREKRRSLQQFHDLRKSRSSTIAASPLKLPWDEYVRQVQVDRYHGLDGRLQMLEHAAELFESKRSFADMNRDERRAIAGTYGSKEETLDRLDWGWFGTMFGQGDFKSLVNKSPQGLSQALDYIPLDGDVTEDKYRAFAETFSVAFHGKTHKGGVATASRLLAMKRPDIFVGVNNANRRKLCNAYEVAHTTLSIDNYWERIVMPIQISAWWQQPRPRTGLYRRVWDNRAALLDCIYYDPNAKKPAK